MREPEGWSDLRPFVREIALQMERNLRLHAHKDGRPIDVPEFFLPAKLAEETSELLMEPSIFEAADVCNIAGMIAANADSDVPHWTDTEGEDQG